jgi:rod shape-determining protein MreB
MPLSFLEPLSRLSKRIGIDLGTSRIRIWSDQDGFLIDEPSCVAVDTTTNKVVGVGQEAQEMVGRTRSEIKVIFPIQFATVQDSAITEAMLKVFLQRILKSSFFFRPLLMVSIPSILGEPEKLALTQMFFGVGFREVNFIDQVLAAAIGAGVPIADASGSFLLHLGHGIAEAGIISLSSLVSVESSFHAGAELSLDIQQFIRQQYHFRIGYRTAERLKEQLLDCAPGEVRQLAVGGQDLLTTEPKELTFSNQELSPLTVPLVRQYTDLAKKLFSHIPPELTTDVIDKGILLTGGLSKLRGLDIALLNALQVPVSCVDEADRVVVKGIAQVLQNLDLFRESVGYRYDAATNG